MRPRIPTGLTGAGLGLLIPAMALAAEGESSNIPKLVNFTILVVILVMALRKPLANYLNARADAIRDQLTQARADRRKAEATAAAAERRAATIDEEVEPVRARIADAAQAEGQRIVAAAQAQADKITQSAETEVEAAVRAAERRLAAGAAQAAVRLARIRLETGMSDEDHERLLETGIRAIRPR